MQTTPRLSLNNEIWSGHHAGKRAPAHPPADRELKKKINAVMDEVNKKMGRNTLKLTAMEFQKLGLTYRGRLSSRATPWKDIFVVKCMEPGNKQNNNNDTNL